MPAERRLLEAGAAHAGLRVDKALAEAFPDLSRSRIHGLLEAGAVLVNGATPKPAARLRAGDRVAIEIPPALASTLVPERGDLAILYEDASLLVVCKPAGVVVHPGAGVATGTLAAALLVTVLLVGIGLRAGPTPWKRRWPAAGERPSGG